MAVDKTETFESFHPYVLPVASFVVVELVVQACGQLGFKAVLLVGVFPGEVALT